MSINEFIKKRPYLVWYTKNFDRLSKESIVEAVLNYGDWDDVQKMISILGMRKIARIFRKWGQLCFSVKRIQNFTSENRDTSNFSHKMLGAPFYESYKNLQDGSERMSELPFFRKMQRGQ